MSHYGKHPHYQTPREKQHHTGRVPRKSEKEAEYRCIDGNLWRRVDRLDLRSKIQGVGGPTPEEMDPPWVHRDQWDDGVRYAIRADGYWHITHVNQDGSVGSEMMVRTAS